MDGSSTFDADREQQHIAGFPCIVDTQDHALSTQIAKKNHSTPSFVLAQEVFVAEGHAMPSTTTSDLSSLTTMRNRFTAQHQNRLSAMTHLLSLPPSLETTDEVASPPKLQKKPLFFEWLHRKGYDALAEQLELKGAHPWEELERLHFPPLIEQLIDIHILSLEKQGTPEECDTLIQFALYVTRLGNEPKNGSTQILGQLIYLINHDLHATLRLISPSQPKETLKQINAAFGHHMQQICERLQHHYLIHEATGLQEPNVAMHAMIPTEVGRALLTAAGTINFGIIGAMSDLFLPQDKPLLNHEINLSYGLSLLQRSPKFRSEFQKMICQKETPLIATLGLITSQREMANLQSNARLAAVTAVLSHLRQGGDRGCFAVSLAIEILSAHLSCCLKDLKQLLEQGKLTRRIGSITYDIPFAMKIADRDLQKTVVLNAQGKLIVDKTIRAPIWEAPGICAACLAIGATDPKKLILAALKQLPQDPISKEYRIEVKTLLLKICEQIPKPDSISLNHLYTRACFGFSSQTVNPLLKTWENGIANMAEMEERGMIKAAILTSTLDALQIKLGLMHVPPTLALQKFLLSAQNILYSKVQLQYDPTIRLPSDLESKNPEGGFVLYHKNGRIDSAAAYRQFLAEILEEAARTAKETIPQAEIGEFQAAFTLLMNHIETEEFLIHLLIKYQPANRFILSHPAKGMTLDHAQLTLTPWITFVGNDSKVLLKNYLGSDASITGESFIFSDGKEALAHIIEICKRMPAKEKELFLNNPHKLKPLCILGKHRFPFMVGHPSLCPSWQHNGSTEDWLQHHFVKPGLEVSNAILDEKTQKAFTSHMTLKLLPLEIPSQKLPACLQALKQIPKGLSIRQFRDFIVDKIVKIHPYSTKSASDKFIRNVDTALFASLTPALKKKLEDSIIHFADTNWSKGVQDVHFCFVTNPGNGKIELWETEANGTHLEALDQSYWIHHQQWEFLSLTEELMPDDFSHIMQTPSPIKDV